jgi:transaldolase
MKFFVDTADVKDIRELNELGLLDGVTTNPSLILKSGRNIAEVTKEICDIVEGPVSAEVAATEYAEMMKEAAVLSKIADNICIKVPLTLDGLKACRALTSEGRMVNVTLCFSGQPGPARRQGGCHLHFAVHRPSRRHGLSTAWS